MIESGYYPAGAEFDANAPYNQCDPEPLEVEVQVTETMVRHTTLEVDDYGYNWGEPDFKECDLNKAFAECGTRIEDLLGLLKDYLKKDLEKATHLCIKAKYADLIKACDEWQAGEVDASLEK